MIKLEAICIQQLEGRAQLIDFVRLLCLELRPPFQGIQLANGIEQQVVQQGVGQIVWEQDQSVNHGNFGELRDMQYSICLRSAHVPAWVAIF